MRQCSRCKQFRNDDEFTARKGRISYTCLVCQRESSRRSYFKHHEKELERDRKYCAENREKRRAYTAQWRARNPDKVSEYNNAHKEENRARGHSWAERNRERVHEIDHKWYAAHKEQKIEYERRYRKANPEKVSVRKARRYARERSSEGSYTAQEWYALCAKYDNKCLRCGEKKKLTPDHVIPVSKGGTSYISNIQPLCFNCNAWKKDKTIDYRGS